MCFYRPNYYENPDDGRPTADDETEADPMEDTDDESPTDPEHD